METYQDLVDDFNRRNPDLLVELQGIPGSYYDKLSGDVRRSAPHPT